ncbi:hypothetical protein DAKH74_027720 [Maudiozyma humilis]|uniref:Thiaminase-2/PQQC domain-containing protein n=1 Tax=Maudiozyma humilis TaxID=51915 RepID=A0AAV5RZF6_MAUHU|nr:hypothetical protein DAKH74_027720 [Kazachstania humilis]
MTYKSVEITSPSPYYLLQKDEQPPSVLVVSDAKSERGFTNEDHIRILAVHGCNSNEYTSKSLVSRLLPDMVAADTAEETNLPARFIKLGYMRDDQLKLSWNAFSELPSTLDSTVVTSGSDLDLSLLGSLNFASLTPFTNKLLVVTVNEVDQYDFFKTSKSTGVGALYNLLGLLKKFTSFDNVLLLNGKDTVICHALYIGNRNEYLGFHSREEITLDSSIVATAILANISKGYTIEEAVYAALEYVQNAVLLGSNGSPNFLYKEVSPAVRMFKDECFVGNSHICSREPIVQKPNIDNFFEFLTGHPLVKPSWETYIHHDFVKQVANNTLPMSKFRFFVEQDYAYLVDYGRIYCIAASKAPSIHDMEEEVQLIGIIRKNGLNPHIHRLKTILGDVDDLYLNNLRRGPALRNYLRYLTEIADNGTWCELIAALTPCMMGYCIAAHLCADNVTAPEGSLYHEWIKIYSDIYDEGMNLGYKFIDLMYKECSGEELDKLIKIWGEVCALETQFWDAALEYNGE